MKKSFNLPNLLSLSRIFLAPLVMVLLSGLFPASLGHSVHSISVGEGLAGIVFILASLTDAVDGYIARSRGLITNFGKFIDPLSDKVLVVGALLALLDLGRIPGWMVMVIITRDFVVSGLRMAAATKGVVIAAGTWGKLKTVTQIVAIVMLIFKLPLAMTVTWISVILTLWSGLTYLYNGWELIDDGDDEVVKNTEEVK